MRKNLLGIFAFCLIVIVACAAPKTTRQNANNITYLKMHRTACFGKCPVYAVEIFNDGRVRYTGFRFTDHIGVYEKNIGPAKAREVLREFQNYRVDTCQSEYFMKIADLPGIIYTINYHKKVKEIKNAHFGPAFLKELGKEIDKAVVVDNTWKKISSSTTQE